MISCAYKRERAINIALAMYWRCMSVSGTSFEEGGSDSTEVDDMESTKTSEEGDSCGWILGLLEISST